MADDKISIKPDGIAVLSPPPPLTAENNAAGTGDQRADVAGSAGDPHHVSRGDRRPLYEQRRHSYLWHFGNVPRPGWRGSARTERNVSAVKSLYDGYEFLYRLIKALGS